jgi:hypothetical protein
MVEAYQDDHGYWKVGCGACGSHSGTLHPNHKPDAKRLVIESWNRRPEEDRLRQLLSEAEKREREVRPGWAFAEGDLVRKKSGSWWEGYVVGTYSTTQTPRGYAVQLAHEFGPVQIYPESALESALKSEER